MIKTITLYYSFIRLLCIWFLKPFQQGLSFGEVYFGMINKIHHKPFIFTAVCYSQSFFAVPYHWIIWHNSPNQYDLTTPLSCRFYVAKYIVLPFNFPEVYNFTASCLHPSVNSMSSTVFISFFLLNSVILLMHSSTNHGSFFLSLLWKIDLL